MRLSNGVLEGVDMVAPASDKGVTTDAEIPHLNQEYCQQLEEHLHKEDHKKKKKQGQSNQCRTPRVKLRE